MQTIISHTARGEITGEYLRLFLNHKLLLISIEENKWSTWGVVSGSLSLFSISATIGVIVSEWVEWLPYFVFVPVPSLWVWNFDSLWAILLHRLYPEVIFLGGSREHLPSVDILFLSRVNLTQCSIILSSCPASLIDMSSICFRVLSSFLEVLYSKVKGETDGSFTLH